MTLEQLRIWRAEQAADAARTLARRREAERGSGVRWSGLAADAFARRTPDGLRRDAAQRFADLQAWRASRCGRLLAAMARAERAAEAVRACVARGLAANDARCGLALRDLEQAAAGARAALDADMSADIDADMDAGACGVLSGGDVQ
jgi:hypothetical protein